MLNKMKKKNETPKLYIQVPKRNEDGSFRVVNLACDKMRSMAGITPTNEILATHFEAERVRMMIFNRDHAGEKDARYIPQPLYIEVRQENFEEILAEIRLKEPHAGNLQQVALSMGTLPCCILSPLHPEEYESKEITN